jgi:hypothetical protein
MRRTIVMTGFALVALGGAAGGDGLFRYATCGVEVALPAAAVCQDIVNEARIGRIINHTCSASLRPPLTVYSVGCDDYPTAYAARFPGDALLRRELRKQVAAWRGLLVRETEVHHGALSGREVVIEFAGHRQFERLFVVGRRLFRVGVVAPAASVPDVARYLDSFNLTAAAK